MVRDLEWHPFTRTRLVEAENRYWLEKRFRVPWLPGRLGSWFASRIADHEERGSRALRDLEGVAVNTRRIAPDTLLREWVEGRDLDRVRRAGDQVPDDFFDGLARILAGIHQRGCSYNDLERKSNVLVTPEGEPVLIDFQILLRPYRGSWGWLRALSRGAVRELQRQDLRYLYKMKRRHRPDLLTAEEERAVLERSALARLYRPVWRVLHGLKRHFWPKGSRNVDPRVRRT